MDNGWVEPGTRHRMVGSPAKVIERPHWQDEMLQLEEQSKAMGALAGGFAHDLNNILGAILGFGERALRTVEAGSRLHHDLNQIVMAGKVGRTLVDRILTFSRGAAGERVPVHVERVVSETLGLLQATLPAHIRLRSRMRSGDATILGDAVQIHQLLMNLGTNAAHAMTRSGTMTVSLEAVTVQQPRQATWGAIAAGCWIALQVADQGSGIPSEIRDRIFEPFFTTKEVGVGTGLGLSLVLRIVTQAGGAIDVESTPDVGSTFTVYLPRSGDAPEQPSNVRPPALPRGRTRRVIVVGNEQA